MADSKPSKKKKAAKAAAAPEAPAAIETVVVAGEPAPEILPPEDAAEPGADAPAAGDPDDVDDELADIEAGALDAADRGRPHITDQIAEKWRIDEEELLAESDLHEPGTEEHWQPLLRIAAAKEAEIHALMNDLQEEQADCVATLKNLRRDHQKLRLAAQQAITKPKNHKRDIYNQWKARQDEQRRERAQRLTAIRQLVPLGTPGLTKAPIDEALNQRKPARGTQRPT